MWDSIILHNSITWLGMDETDLCPLCSQCAKFHLRKPGTEAIHNCENQVKKRPFPCSTKTFYEWVWKIFRISLCGDCSDVLQWISDYIAVGKGKKLNKLHENVRNWFSPLFHWDLSFLIDYLIQLNTRDPELPRPLMHAQPCSHLRQQLRQNCLWRTIFLSRERVLLAVWGKTWGNKNWLEMVCSHSLAPGVNMIDYSHKIFGVRSFSGLFEVTKMAENDSTLFLLSWKSLTVVTKMRELFSVLSVGNEGA